jgi:hypothetical protein
MQYSPVPCCPGYIPFWSRISQRVGGNHNRSHAPFCNALSFFFLFGSSGHSDRPASGHVTVTCMARNRVLLLPTRRNPRDRKELPIRLVIHVRLHSHILLSTCSSNMYYRKKMYCRPQGRSRSRLRFFRSCPLVFVCTLKLEFVH